MCQLGPETSRYLDKTGPLEWGYFIISGSVKQKSAPDFSLFFIHIAMSF